MDIVILANQYQKIREEERKQEAWQMWITQFHFMVTGQIKYQSFTEYYDQVSGKNFDARPTKEILAEVEEIRKYV